MLLESIEISNFKGLRSATFSPKRFGCLIGENNAGKSSVLQAIVSAVNRQTSLPASLYYDPTQPVVFRVNFSGVSEAHVRRLAPEHRQKAPQFIFDEWLRLVVRCPPNEKGEVRVIAKTPREARLKQDSIDAAFLGKRGNAVRDTLVALYPEAANGVADGLNITEAKEHLRRFTATLPAEAFEDTEVPLPSGIPTSIGALLPDPIYIPAVKNLAEEMKTSQQASFGKLLGLLLEGMTPDLTQIRDALGTLNRLFNRIEEDGQIRDDRHDKVKAMEGLVESLLRENFPQVSVELRVPPPELKTILNNAEIFVDDGSKDLIEHKGDGIKRSLTFCLLQAYVERTKEPPEAADPNAAARQPLLFLFEEPELYLHPRSQRILFDTLARISTEHQVVVSTHSPLFFAPGITASFVRVAKQPADPKPVGTLYPVEIELGQAQADTFRLARFENADAAFFSRRIVLFEGESDDAYCRHVAPLLNPDWNFDRKNVAMVRVSGKGNFARFRTFFQAFGVEVKIVADLDALFDGYEHLGGNADAGTVRARALQLVDERAQALNLQPRPTADQIKNRTQRQTWRERWDSARATIQEIQANGNATPEQLGQLDQLFLWEQDIVRLQACQSDAEAAAAIVPLLDSLRQQGICVLWKGSVENYYPEAAPRNGPKPDRALLATRSVGSQEDARALSEPLHAGRATELEEVFAELFRDL